MLYHYRQASKSTACREVHRLPTRCPRRGRGAEVARQLLLGYRGIVVTDDYRGYHFLDETAPGFPEWIQVVRHALCWAHARRKFVAVVKGLEDPKSLKPDTITARTLDAIRQLYALERKADSLAYSESQRLKMRQEETAPLLARLKAELDDFVTQYTATGNLAKAIDYVQRNWQRLTVFLDNPLVDPDNNWAENSIRPFVIGRKNWMFNGSPAGAKAGAVLYSLASTATANGLNEYQYFRHLFEKLPYAETQADFRALLPTEFKPSLEEDS